ncbi:MAG: hypothetical protein LBF78_06725, partial [Treponema sp.]|nr:hypothetical protein [Treponema sp.]
MEDDYLDLLSDIIRKMDFEPTVLFIGDNSQFDDSEDIFSLPWSCVYTTVRQENLVDKFKMPGRRVIDITARSDSKNIGIKRRELSLVRLHGMDSVTIDPIEQETTTQAFLETIPNNLRSYGCILIDGLVNNDSEIKSLVMQLGQISHRNS